MKTIFILFDSLNKRMLSPYGCDWVHTPNFKRLQERAITFNNHYVGSLPCMPARRDIHTGRVNFLHRSWGPLEPYDESIITLLRQQNIYTHLISDHNHYWEEGGSNYHTKYDTWEIIRGQEGDKWLPHLEEVNVKKMWGRADEYRAQDMVNRVYIKEHNVYPIAQVFGKGIDFLQENYEKDNWLLQIESFDPHEPFFSEAKYKELYGEEWEEGFDWPSYEKVKDSHKIVEICRKEYAALVTACDDYLGKVLDFMDAKDMWKSTTLIVTTDHGYLLGEHGWWAKTVQPIYNEVAQIPLFFWSPLLKEKNVYCERLTQNIDITPTVLEGHGVNVPDTVLGKSLLRKSSLEEARSCLYGVHGCHICITDGRYVYMRKPIDETIPVYNYTLMPSHMKVAFSKEEFSTLEVVEPFKFTKGYPLLKFATKKWAPIDFNEYGNLLFDLEVDPNQEHPLEDSEKEQDMLYCMRKLLEENECPQSIFERYHL